MLVGSYLPDTESFHKLSWALTSPYTASPAHLVSFGNFCFLAIQWTPQESLNQTQSSSLPNDTVEGKNSTSPTRTPRLPDATSATCYILAIIGIYWLIFVFLLASNILRKNERSLEGVYYSNVTAELKRKGFQSKVARYSSLIISNTAVLQPQQLGREPVCEDRGLHVGTQPGP